MSELTDLVSSLERKYGTPPENIPKDDPDFVTLQRKYWLPEDTDFEGRQEIYCKVINLETQEEHTFKSFTQASKFYGFDASWACRRYRAQKTRNRINSKYKVIKL
ncbi:hypothetical protein [Bombilactobacillus mellis]|uniref:hypothetical protein n=1 Tax=Bombilactobacillus mellis TaxID=1218508 RepID=UPI0015811EEF|nr:hypothetical protein [Bombilactobacillus mellis]NUF26352.1 hypothetical protein [Bombilactobacillus mellis]